MTKKELEQVVQAVDNINADIEKCYPGGTNNVVLQYIDQTNGQCVAFLDDELWSSVNEQREYIDFPVNDWEPIEPYLRKKINEMIAEINKIKV